MSLEEPWKDRKILRDLYHNQGLTSREVGDRLGVSHKTVLYWMEKLGVDRDEPQWRGPRTGRARFFTHPSGYERWESISRGVKTHADVHRLLAVAEYGFDELEGSEVHHINQIPWDNRPSNIEVLSSKEHKSLHAIERDRNELGQFVGRV